MDRSFQNVKVTIGTGAGDATQAIQIPDRAFGSVQFPASMTGTKLLIEGRNAGNDTWGAVLGAETTQLEIPAAANSVVRIPDGAFGCSEIRFKSDATEASERTFDVHVQS